MRTSGSLPLGSLTRPALTASSDRQTTYRGIYKCLQTNLYLQKEKYSTDNKNNILPTDILDNTQETVELFEYQRSLYH